ncbi:DAD-1-like protein [Gorgonomyces haynaldii]|nr:DAD-1-like protein [Gorgonomyces haynaldii]
MVTGVTQMLYMLIVGQYPYNAFLSSFVTNVGSFCLGANLRIQLNPENKGVHPQRAFADFVFAQLVLFGFCINFVG